jgi:hypothetical protein
MAGLMLVPFSKVLVGTLDGMPVAISGFRLELEVDLASTFLLTVVFFSSCVFCLDALGEVLSTFFRAEGDEEEVTEGDGMLLLTAGRRMDVGDEPLFTRPLEIVSLALSSIISCSSWMNSTTDSSPATPSDGGGANSVVFLFLTGEDELRRGMLLLPDDDVTLRLLEVDDVVVVFRLAEEALLPDRVSPPDVDTEDDDWRDTVVVTVLLLPRVFSAGSGRFFASREDVADSVEGVRLTSLLRLGAGVEFSSARLLPVILADGTGAGGSSTSAGSGKSSRESASETLSFPFFIRPVDSCPLSNESG